MAGLIDVGIIKPELATSFATGYRGAEQARQQQELTQQKLESDRIHLEQLKQDRQAMLQLQSQLQAAGRDPDLDKIFDALIATGKPDYMLKGMEGKQRLQEQRRSESILRQIAPELFPSTPGAKPTVPTAPAAAAAPAMGVPAPVNALAAAQPSAPAPTNALAIPAMPGAPAAAPAPVNALAMPGQPAAAPAATPTSDRVLQLRRNIMALSSINDPRAKAMVDAMQNELKELGKTHVVSGQLVTGTGDVKYSGPTDIGRLDGEIATLRGQGVPDTDPRISSRLAMIQKLTTHAPGSVTNVNVSTEKKYGEKFGGLLAERDVGLMDAASNAPRAAENADRIYDLVASGKVFTGTGANVRLQIAKALNVAGGTDSEKIANTEVLLSSLARQTLSGIKTSGLGAGQGFTNTDRDYLERAESGQISYDAKSLMRLADLARRVAEKSAEAWNTRVKNIPASALQGTGISTEPIIVPKRSRGGATPAVRPPAVGTEQNGYRFKGGDPADAANWEKL